MVGVWLPGSNVIAATRCSSYRGTSSSGCPGSVCRASRSSDHFAPNLAVIVSMQRYRSAAGAGQTTRGALNRASRRSPSRLIWRSFWAGFIFFYLVLAVASYWYPWDAWHAPDVDLNRDCYEEHGDGASGGIDNSALALPLHCWGPTQRGPRSTTLRTGAVCPVSEMLYQMSGHSNGGVTISS